ncbi:hypothetical protein INT43_007076 [Umbelopsis isabellina]|uniref:Uncharacterized protein n=1 Tax=Mortierella isabellina TaxID=91625 RepID=A0A8H7PZ80_MORIS|nr:hypothetical protein INT43_007076 [Umbelopsis isabellina]
MSKVVRNYRMDLLDAEENEYDIKTAGSVDATENDQDTHINDNAPSLAEEKDITLNNISDTGDDKGRPELTELEPHAQVETELENSDKSNFHSIEATPESTVTAESPAQSTESIIDDIDKTNNENQINDNEYEEFEFDEFRDSQADDFGDFGAFDETGQDGSGVDDEFGDFGEFGDVPQPESIPADQEIEKHIAGIEGYVEALRDGNLASVTEFLDKFFDETLTSTSTLTSLESSNETSPNEAGSDFKHFAPHQEVSEGSKAYICTNLFAPYHRLDLWNKLSTDSVFYNPLTGAVGQFQWTRSEINKVYLRSLGVTINIDDAFNHTSSSVPSSPYAEAPRSANARTSPSYLDAKSPSPLLDRKRSPKRNLHTKANSLSGISLPIRESSPVETKRSEPEPELDIDVARAYCELTEDTVRVFPSVKLTSIITDLTRLQRQAADYLQYLLDQREQLIMDSETYNDLISCIVGHAQRLRDQNPKDASPAMVQKKKQGNGLSLKRKSQATSTGQAAFSASMGGGVVGIKNTTTGTTPKKLEREQSTSSIKPVATTSSQSHKAAKKESLLD